MGFVGFFNAPVLSIALEFSAEATYPVSETFSCGLLNLSSSILGIPVNLLMGYLIDNYENYIA